MPAATNAGKENAHLRNKPPGYLLREETGQGVFSREGEGGRSHGLDLESGFLEVVQDHLVLDRDILGRRDVELLQDVERETREHDVGIVGRRTVLLVNALEQTRNSVSVRAVVSMQIRKGESQNARLTRYS